MARRTLIWRWFADANWTSAELPLTFPFHVDFPKINRADRPRCWKSAVRSTAGAAEALCDSSAVTDLPASTSCPNCVILVVWSHSLRRGGQIQPSGISVTGRQPRPFWRPPSKGRADQPGQTPKPETFAPLGLYRKSVDSCPRAKRLTSVASLDSWNCLGLWDKEIRYVHWRAVTLASWEVCALLHSVLRWKERFLIQITVNPQKSQKGEAGLPSSWMIQEELMKQVELNFFY